MLFTKGSLQETGKVEALTDEIQYRDALVPTEDAAFVPHASSMLFDDGEGYVYVYIIYDCSLYDHECISKLLLESELDLLKHCNIDILTSILTQNKLKCTSHCCACLKLQKQENWEKNFGKFEVIHQIHQTFLPPKFFYHKVSY